MGMLEDDLTGPHLLDRTPLERAKWSYDKAVIDHESLRIALQVSARMLSDAKTRLIEARDDDSRNKRDA